MSDQTVEEQAPVEETVDLGEPAEIIEEIDEVEHAADLDPVEDEPVIAPADYKSISVVFDLEGDLANYTIEQLLAPFDLAARTLPAGVSIVGGGSYSFSIEGQ